MLRICISFFNKIMQTILLQTVFFNSVRLYQYMPSMQTERCLINLVHWIYHWINHYDIFSFLNRINRFMAINFRILFLKIANQIKIKIKKLNKCPLFKRNQGNFNQKQYQTQNTIQSLTRNRNATYRLWLRIAWNKISIVFCVSIVGHFQLFA